jgi:hypothetical protein
MRRSGFVMAVACAAVAVSGFFGGELLAVPVSTAGGNVLPAARPAPGVYTYPLFFAGPTAGTLTFIQVGRDDTSPYVAFPVTLQGTYGAPGGGILYPALTTWTFTYRPLWDPAVPALAGAGGSQIGEHWLAVDVFAAKLQMARQLSRTTPPPFLLWGISIWVDPTQVGNGTTYDDEFYKFDIYYN